MINEYLKDNALLVVPNNIKEEILEYLDSLNTFINIKIMTKEDFYKEYLFSYKKDAIIYLSETYHMKPSISKVYLDNLIYVEDKTYNNVFLDKIVSIKNDLINNDLLHTNNTFLNLVANKKVVVNYDLNDFDKRVFSNIENVTIVKPVDSINKEINYITFSSILEEVTYVVEDIISKIKLGTDINNIFITNLSDDYKNILKTTCYLYDIPINMNDKTCLFGTKLSNDFLNYLTEYNAFQEVIDKFTPSDELNKIINIINSYAFYNGKISDLIPFIKEDIKNINIKDILYKNAINVVDLDHKFSSNDIVYLMSFNSDTLPNAYSDDEFISDENKHILGLFDTEYKNVNSRRKTINNILNIPNVLVTFSKNGLKGETFISNLSDDLKMHELPKNNNLIIYSNLAKRVELTKLLDTYSKYGDIKNKLKELYTHYGLNTYKTYDNKFSGIDNNNFLDYIHNSLTLSYSSMDNYYKCAFRYYLNNILKVNIYETSFAINIGTIFHEILSKAFIDNFDFNTSWNKELSNYKFNNMEIFLLSKLKNELKFIINTINKQMNDSSVKNILCEKEISITSDIGIKVTFKGFVDKILFAKKNDKTYIVVIDYKTGHPSTDLKHIKYGLEMQLPVYLYLIKNSKLFSNIKFVGFYLQKILNNEIRIVKGKSYNDQKEANLKLVGYTNSDSSVAQMIDKNFDNSNIVNGLKLKKDGTFYSTSKVLDDESITELITVVDEKIKMCSKDIMNANFVINPKNVDGENLGCKYCPFNDICYKTDKDTVYIKESGDDNAKVD